MLSHAFSFQGFRLRLDSDDHYADGFCQRIAEVADIDHYDALAADFDDCICRLARDNEAFGFLNGVSGGARLFQALGREHDGAAGGWATLAWGYTR